MNKKLLSLAVGAALSAAPLFAQADTVVYGKVHISIDAPDADNAAVVDDTSMVSNSSRLGVKGSEDLGNGLSALYQYEMAMEPVENGGAAVGNSRNSFLGLKGGFGTVLFGRHDTPMKDVARAYDLFGDQIGDSRNILRGAGGGIGSGARFDERWGNSIRYMTPKLGAFSAEAQYSLDQSGGGAADNGDTDGWSLNGRFDGGMFDVMAGYESQNDPTQDTSAFRLAGGVNFDPFRIVALWQSVSDEGNTAGRDRDAYGVGAAMKMGNNRVKLQYYTADDADGDASSGADMWAIGLDHKFSKRTTAYVAYATVDNDTNARFVPWGQGHGLDINPDADGADPSVFSVGMIHSF